MDRADSDLQPSSDFSQQISGIVGPRAEEELRRNQEEIRRREGIRIGNLRGQEIADVSGLRALMEEAKTALSSYYPSVVLVEAWGLSSIRDNFRQDFRDHVQRNFSLIEYNYYLKLAWDKNPDRRSPVQVTMDDYYDYVQVGCDGREGTLRFYEVKLLAGQFQESTHDTLLDMSDRGLLKEIILWKIQHPSLDKGYPTWRSQWGSSDLGPTRGLGGDHPNSD